MERKNISFQYGIKRSPSAADEGELSECINLEAHNGELTPSVMPKIEFTLSEGDKLLFVHKSGNYKNYIIQRGSSLCWFSENDKSNIKTIGTITPTSIHSVGNTLVVLSGEQMEYILYKSGNYKRIGSKPPFCSISFGLKQEQSSGTGVVFNGESVLSEKMPDLDYQYGQYLKGDLASLNYNYENRYNSSVENEDGSTSAVVNSFTEQIHAILNPVKKLCRKKGLFYDSFFIRYAYRLYDGSHYMQSAPIFMPIGLEGPIILSQGQAFDREGNVIGVRNHVGLNACKVDYDILGLYTDGAKEDNEILKDWEDVIEGLDIFVSPSISRFPESNKVWGLSSKASLSDSICFTGNISNSRANQSDNDYKNRLYKDIYGAYKVVSGKDEWVTFDLELTNQEDFVKSIEETSLFYKVYSINSIDNIVKSIGNDRETLIIKENILENLEQQEVLEDDYDSHNDVIPSFAHVYNGRLNISGIRSKLFSGFPMESMVPYTYSENGTNYTWAIQSSLEIEGKDVSLISVSNIPLYERPAFIYYPSTKCTGITLHKYDSSQISTSLSLSVKAEVHKLLNGAYYLSPTVGVSDSYTFGDTPRVYGNRYISYPNKIYTSEVNNPFFFPLSGRNSIGTGEIIAVSSNTKAISPGQFGQYPLIVFSTDGVWAMQTGEEGLYQSIHPISKDVCINPNVLQTDGPIIFATANGLHSVISDQVTNISEDMKGRPESIDLPFVNNDFDSLVSLAKDSDTFNDFIKDATFAYDYVNRRIIINNARKNFAYVLSMKSGMYSKLVIGDSVVFGSAVNAYPEVYMQSGVDIYTFVQDTDKSDEIYHGLAATRTLSFSDPLAMKVINDVRLICHKSKFESRCRYAMYVSNDGYQWMQRTSLCGRSFKYFRFVIFTDLADIDALQGMSVAFSYRRSHKLR